MSDRLNKPMPIGIGTTFDYGLQFEPMCRMIAQAGFRAVSIGGGDIAHSGYDTQSGRDAILDKVSQYGLRIDSVHAPFGPEADLSVPDLRTEVPGENANPKSEIPTPEILKAQPSRTDNPQILDSSSSTALPDSRPLVPRYSYSPDDRRVQAITRAKVAVDAAAALNSGTVVVHPCAGFPAEETRARINAAKDSLRQLVRYAAERNIRLALENLASPLSMQVFEAVLEHVPELGVCYDTSHAQIAGDTFGIVARHADRIIAVHLSDNRGANDDHMLPFEGVLPWEEFAYYLPRLRNLGCFMLEVEIRESAFKDRGEFLAEAFRRARQVMELIAPGRQSPKARAR